MSAFILRLCKEIWQASEVPYILYRSINELLYITDDKAVLDFFRDNSGKSAEEFTHAYLSNTKFFGGEDLTKVAGLEETITEYIKDIRERGMRAVVNDLALD